MQMLSEFSTQSYTYYVHAPPHCTKCITSTVIDVDAHNTTTPSDDGDHASTQSGHNDPSGDNSHSVIPSGSNGGSGPSRRRSGHSDGHAGSVGGLTPGGTSGTGNVSSHARSGHDDGCISVHGLTSSSDGGSVSDGNLGDGHVGTACGLSPTSENREADPSEMVIPILIEDDEGGYLVGDVEQFIMVSIRSNNHLLIT